MEKKKIFDAALRLSLLKNSRKCDPLASLRISDWLSRYAIKSVKEDITDLINPENETFFFFGVQAPDNAHNLSSILRRDSKLYAENSSQHHIFFSQDKGYKDCTCASNACITNFGIARDLFPKRKDNALFFLGFACHYVCDMSLWPHVFYQWHKAPNNDSLKRIADKHHFFEKSIIKSVLTDDDFNLEEPNKKIVPVIPYDAVINTARITYFGKESLGCAEMEKRTKKGTNFLNDTEYVHTLQKCFSTARDNIAGLLLYFKEEVK